MIDRKKKLRFIQSFLLIFAILVIYLTYYKNQTNLKQEIISPSSKERLKELSSNKNSENSDMFFNIEYTGLDLNGNRYLLKSEEVSPLDCLMSLQNRIAEVDQHINALPTLCFDRAEQKAKNIMKRKREKINSFLFVLIFFMKYIPNNLS